MENLRGPQLVGDGYGAPGVPELEEAFFLYVFHMPPHPLYHQFQQWNRDPQLPTVSNKNFDTLWPHDWLPPFQDQVPKEGIISLLQENNVTTAKLSIFDIFTRNFYINLMEERQNVSNTSRHQKGVMSLLNLPCCSHFSCLENFKSSFWKIMIFAVVMLFFWRKDMWKIKSNSFAANRRVIR